MPYTLTFADERATEHDVVGGKGANLARLFRTGFDVPGGFVVTTEAYTGFLSESGLLKQIPDLAASFDHADPERLESQTSYVRELITKTEIPAPIADAVRQGYRALNGAAPVAVRSSGIAEDLAEASFAGQHDTYLGIQGEDDVLDAVKRCWASLWTARATAYRDKHGFDHLESALAVVVQELVDSDVAGVLFTGNPMTGATDELVVNASWGLGESVVSGMVTPDEYVLTHDDLRVTRRVTGSKTIRIDRVPGTGGTVESEVSAADQARPCLSEEIVRDLGELGRRVQQQYGGLPQDIEWALHDGRLYLLQARPITGAAFAWDAEVDTWHHLTERDDAVWTRSYADEIWSGPISPLMYSYRDYCIALAHKECYGLWNMPEGVDMRVTRYWKGTAYYNTDVEKLLISHSMPRAFRPAMTAHLSPADLDEVLAGDFGPMNIVKLHLRIMGLAGDRTIHNWMNLAESYLRRIEEAEGHSNEELRRLSDEGLIRYAEQMIQLEAQYCVDIWSGYFIHVPLIFNLLGGIVTKFYDGDNDQVLWDLLTGTPVQSATVKENLGLWELSTRLRADPELLNTFRTHRDGEFFTALEDSEAGRAWLADYLDWRAEHHHRGHSDRDIYFARRSEDPSLDYGALTAMLTTDDDHDPIALEHATNARRLAAVDDVIASLRRRPFGALLVEGFKWLYDEVMKLNVHRDDERHWVDRSTFTIKRTFLELSRRLIERDVLTGDQDFYFLSRHELYDLLRDRTNPPLTRAKITARQANFDRLNAKEADLPKYLQHNREIAFGEKASGEAALLGMGTSPGTVSGTARVIKTIKEIGRIRKGDILICHATDPGWAAAFLAVRGVVAETGGMLAHFSCLSREYGIPAIQLDNAMKHIPDGATLTINGATGRVTLDDPAPESSS